MSERNRVRGSVARAGVCVGVDRKEKSFNFLPKKRYCRNNLFIRPNFSRRLKNVQPPAYLFLIILLNIIRKQLKK